MQFLAKLEGPLLLASLLLVQSPLILAEDSTQAYRRLEHKVYEAQSDGRFANPAHTGLESGYGRLQAGFLDTPYKSLATPFNIMDETIADVRDILGYRTLGTDASSDRNVGARNAIMIQKAFARLSLSALYSFDDLTESADSRLEHNYSDRYSTSLVYQDSKLLLGLATERGLDDDSLNGVRLGARYDFGSFNSGLILEQFGARQTTAFRRQAAAFDVQYSLSHNNTAKFQLGYASDHDGTYRSGATQFAIGDYHAVSDDLTVYLVYNRLSNDDNARYRSATDTDDIFSPLYGADPWALSLGVRYRLGERINK